jgi:microcystin-dependent protein
MWSGANNTWPSNWALCNGANGTPNLQGRFVLSSGSGSGLSARTIGQTGGAETVALTLAQMPSHSHAVAVDKVTGGGHNHTGVTASYGVPAIGVAESPGTIGGDGTSQRLGYDPAIVFTVSATSSEHSHSITLTESTRGSNNAHENMPPFYVLAFIMRVS